MVGVVGEDGGAVVAAVEGVVDQAVIDRLGVSRPMAESTGGGGGSRKNELTPISPRHQLSKKNELTPIISDQEK